MMTRVSLRQRNKLVIVQYIQQGSTLEGEEEENKNEMEKGKQKTTTTVSGLLGCSTEPFGVFFCEPPLSPPHLRDKGDNSTAWHADGPGRPLATCPLPVLLLLFSSSHLLCFISTRLPLHLIYSPLSHASTSVCISFLPCCLVQLARTTHLQASDHTLSSLKQPLTSPGMPLNLCPYCSMHLTCNPILHSSDVTSLWQGVCVSPSCCTHCSLVPDPELVVLNIY